jgi:hypothetical protein
MTELKLPKSIKRNCKCWGGFEKMIEVCIKHAYIIVFLTFGGISESSDSLLMKFNQQNSCVTIPLYI